MNSLIQQQRTTALLSAKITRLANRRPSSNRPESFHAGGWLLRQVLAILTREVPFLTEGTPPEFREQVARQPGSSPRNRTVDPIFGSEH